MVLLMSCILQVWVLHFYHFSCSIPTVMHALVSHIAIFPAPPVSQALLLQVSLIILHKRRSNVIAVSNY